MTWDSLYELQPTDLTVVADTDDAIRSLKVAVRERFAREHQFDVTDNDEQGRHAAGSAKAWYQSAAPTYRQPIADLVDLGEYDVGQLWIDSDTHVMSVWTWDSDEEVGAFEPLSYIPTQVFITSGDGDWTVPAGVHQIRVKCIGGGGGGGGVLSSSSYTRCAGGGGGIFTDLVPWSVLSVTPGDEKAYVVGAGGTAGSTSGGDGGTGGTTTFTGATSGPGATGGKGVAVLGFGAKGGIGPAGYGAPGGNGIYAGDNGTGGDGGGAGGRGSNYTTGESAIGYGGGGAGAAQIKSAPGSFAGGVGGSGLIIIEY